MFVVILLSVNFVTQAKEKIDSYKNYVNKKSDVHSVTCNVQTNGLKQLEKALEGIVDVSPWHDVAVVLYNQLNILWSYTGLYIVEKKKIIQPKSCHIRVFFYLVKAIYISNEVDHPLNLCFFFLLINKKYLLLGLSNSTPFKPAPLDIVDI